VFDLFSYQTDNGENTEPNAVIRAIEGYHVK